MKKLRVLISAYACEPDKGSEPGVGWNWVKQISRFHETWVITRSNNRKSIEEALTADPIGNPRFVYVDLPKWASFWKKRQRGVYLYYLIWQIFAFITAYKMVRTRNFNIVHHLTFGNLWMPTFFAFLPVSFVWGPIGGGEKIPKAFLRGFSFRCRLIEYLRRTFIFTLRFNMLFYCICKRATIIITKTKDTADKIPKVCASRVYTTTDVAVSGNGNISLHPDHDEVTILAVGTLESWRGIWLLIRAVSRSIREYPRIKLIVIGHGPDKVMLQRISKEEGIQDKTFFTGQVSHSTYLEYLIQTSIFANPCLKEGGVTAVFDALLEGIPVICLDVAGTPELITEEIGIKIKPINPEQTINEFANAIIRLARDSNLRKRMGTAAKEKASKEFNWDVKGETIMNLYQSVLGDR